MRLKHWIKHPPEVNENTAKYTIDASGMAAVDANKLRYQVRYGFAAPDPSESSFGSKALPERHPFLLMDAHTWKGSLSRGI